MNVHGLVIRASSVAFAMAVVGSVSGSCAAPTTLREARFDAPSDTIVTPAGRGYRLLREGDETFFIPFQGVTALPFFSSATAMSAPRSLGLRVGPSAPGQTKNDRAEFTVAHQGDPGSLKLDQDRWFGFDIYFDRHDFPSPTREIIIAQIWQPTPVRLFGPPAFIAMLPSNDLQFKLATRDDANTAAHPSDEVPLRCTHFEREHWNAVVLHIVPRPDADAESGLIEMWLNGRRIGGVHRHWGYASGRGVFDVRTGLYANPQNVAHAVWIDNVKFGTTRESVESGLHADAPPDSSPLSDCAETMPVR